MYTQSHHPSHPHDSLPSIIAQAQQDHALFPQPSVQRQPVVVAVSGGVDSVTLLHILMQMADEWRLELHIAHVDHDLRPDAELDAMAVRELAVQMRLPFHTTRLDAVSLHADRAGLEAAARTARYRFLCATAINVTPGTMVPIIAAAHHADDQAETLLLRLTQGSGLGGLAAMHTVTILDDPPLTPRAVRLVRPLLAASRTEITAYAQRHSLSWREDESNTDETRSRNLIRRQVLPLLARINPQVIATLARTANLIAAEHERLQSLDEEKLRQSTVLKDEKRIVLRLSALQELAPPALRGLLHTALSHFNADTREIGATQIDTACASILQAHRISGPHPLANNLAWSIVTVSGGDLQLSLHRRAALPLPPPCPWINGNQRNKTLAVPLEGEITLGAWVMRCQLIERQQLPQAWRQNPDRWMAFFDADKPFEPVLTAARPGLKIDPLGMEGKHKQIGDIFTNHKVSPALRHGWPVLLNKTDGRLMWLCGLTQSHTTRITEATRLVWLVHFIVGHRGAPDLMETRIYTPADLQRFLDEHAVKAELLPDIGHTPTVPAAAMALGVETAQIVKTLLFLVELPGEETPSPVVVISHGERRIDKAKVAERFGVGKKRVTLAPADVVVATLGYPAGGVPPFGHTVTLPMIVDASIGNLASHSDNVIYAGGGDDRTMMRLTVEELLRVTAAEVLAVS